MYPHQFVSWLSGFFDLHESNNLTEEEVKVIKEHLDKIFNNTSNWNNSPFPHLGVPASC